MRLVEERRQTLRQMYAACLHACLIQACCPASLDPTFGATWRLCPGRPVGSGKSLRNQSATCQDRKALWPLSPPHRGLQHDLQGMLWGPHGLSPHPSWSMAASHLIAESDSIAAPEALAAMTPPGDMPMPTVGTAAPSDRPLQRWTLSQLRGERQKFEKHILKLSEDASPLCESSWRSAWSPVLQN